jgi:hypothetical protein
MTISRRNRINGQWSARLIEMLESPAYRTLSLSAHRVISRIEIELGHHAGNDNDKLPVTCKDFIEYGVDRAAVAPAIREAETLGFIRVTEHGRGGNREYRKPNLFGLTFAHGRDSRSKPPTHEWRNIKTTEEALQIARAARAAKNSFAVARGRNFAKRRAGKQASDAEKNQKTNAGKNHLSMREFPIEKPKLPMLVSRTTGSPEKTGSLSIVGVGGGALIAPAAGNGKAGTETDADWLPDITALRAALGGGS